MLRKTKKTIFKMYSPFFGKNAQKFNFFHNFEKMFVFREVYRFQKMLSFSKYVHNFKKYSCFKKYSGVKKLCSIFQNLFTIFQKKCSCFNFFAVSTFYSKFQKCSHISNFVCSFSKCTCF